MFSGPALHVPDEVLVEVRRQGGGEGAGGPRRGGRRGRTGSAVDAGGDVVGTWGGTPLTAGMNRGEARQHGREAT